jgi:hypothetical protein
MRHHKKKQGDANGHGNHQEQTPDEVLDDIHRFPATSNP